MTYLLTPNGRKQLMSESTQQVDELSKKTLGSYVKKASSDMADKLDSASKSADKSAAVKKQMKRGNNNNYERGAEAEKNTDKAYGGYVKRKRGIAKAVGKLTKEEIDMDHFVEYVMENFPELTEKYIQENYKQEN